MMEREHILPILYEMALVIGGETRLKPLLTKTLQRLLYYTSFPAGFVCLDLPPPRNGREGMIEARIDSAVGDYHLAGLVGQFVPLPAALLHGEALRNDDATPLAALPGTQGHYTAFLRLPVDACGVIVLLSPQLPETEFPLTRIFQPVMANLAKAIMLCRHHEAYASGLVAERDRAEASLRQSQEHLHLAAEVIANTHSGVMITDTDGHILSANHAFSQTTGYASEDVIGKNPRLLSSGHHDRDFYRAMWRDLNASGYWQGEIWNRRKNGEVFPEWLSISAIHDQDGRLTNYVGIFTDISERKAAEERIEFLAHHDPLTGLPNRVLLRDRFERALVHAAHERSKVALLYLDLDNFNNINDSLGHPLGDRLLQMAAERIRSAVRRIDTVSRMGGDEFLVMLTEERDDDAVALSAGKILDRIAQAMQLDGHNLSISCTIGISIYPNDGNDFDTLLKHADTALRHAKTSGRNTYLFFTEAMNLRAMERMHLVSRLRTALPKGEFLLHYQPKIDLKTGRITGAEALIRWKNEDLGLTPPARFIPIAEECGLIVPIGTWVLHEACRQLSSWHAAGLPLPAIAVNLSAMQFKRGSLLESVAAALRESKLDPRCLELELTESILIHDAEHTLEMVHALKALGISLSIDDFGTGYSSLAYLKRFAVDTLKIDQSFVRDMCDDTDAAAIVRAVIQLARSLSLKTIAEGVETLEQRNLLCDLDCNEMQGHFFSPPLPAEDFRDLLRRHLQFTPTSEPEQK